MHTNISELSIKEINSGIIKPHEVKEIYLQYTPKFTNTLSFANILTLIQGTYREQFISGYVRVKTSQDL